MARKLRIQYEGAIYHVTARGVERRVIFDDDKDREHFVKRLEEAVEATGVRLYLFCLMSNHYHFLVETPRDNLSAFMHKVQTAHTVYYNLRHQRAGHLMQGRYTAKVVQGDDYLGRLSRYIHLNPVFVGSNQKKPLSGRIKLLRDYKWSSYQGYAGIMKSWGFVDEWPILEMFSGRKESDRRKRYRKFVEAGIASSDEEFKRIIEDAVWGIGDDEFCGRMRDLHTDMSRKVMRREDVALRQRSLAIKPENVVNAVAGVLGVEVGSLKKRSYGNQARALAAKMLIRYSGMNQRDAGSYLKIGTGAAVCQQLKVLSVMLETNKGLKSTVFDIEKRLNNLNI